LGPIGLNCDSLGKTTFGELVDLYNAHNWRLERARLETAQQTFILGRAWGMELEIEDILGRNIYPALRSIEAISGDEAMVDRRPREVKLAEAEEVREHFRSMGLADELEIEE
jgi:hypothetical protein